MSGPPRFRLQRVQVIPRPLPEVFAFFADAGNLQSITPDFLDFRIVTPLPLTMRAGALLDYRLALFGVRFGWQTRIECWDPPTNLTRAASGPAVWRARFVDRQLRGPYTRWEHEHRFEADGEATRMTDMVDYELPLGPAGRVVHALFVRRALERIFDHRRARVAELLAPVRMRAAEVLRT